MRITQKMVDEAINRLNALNGIEPNDVFAPGRYYICRNGDTYELHRSSTDTAGTHGQAWRCSLRMFYWLVRAYADGYREGKDRHSK